MWTSSQSNVARQGSFDACRLKPVPCDGYVDNDALRLAVGRGSSPCARLDVLSFPGAAHNFAQSGEYNRKKEADIMAKVISAARHRDLCKTDFDLDAVPVASVTHAVFCRHDGKVWERQKKSSHARVLQLNG